MIEDKKLPKPMFDPDNPTDMKADMLINMKTGAVLKKKDDFEDSVFPHTTFPSMGSSYTPSHIQSNIDCEILRTKIMDMKKYGGTPSLASLETIFHGDKFPKNTRFQCSDCPLIPPFQYISDMIHHGVKAHFRPTYGVLDFILNVVNEIEKR